MNIIKNKHSIKYSLLWLFFISLFCNACNENPNNPYSKKFNNKIVFHTSFSQQPKTLDPAKSYSSDETLFTANIYEPIMQYDYLARPYRLVPLTAEELPQVKYFDKNMKKLPDNASDDKIAFSQYQIHIRKNIFYQEHPAFAKNKDGQYIYFNLTKKQLDHIRTLSDFAETGSRELTVDDYIYEIKRLADPKIQSPIYGLMKDYIVGFDELNQVLTKYYAQNKSNLKPNYVDLNLFNLSGVTKRDRYTFDILIKGKYPQFIYWLSMPFFAPIPWEADKFYANAYLQQKNISFDWYPVGTGAYMLAVNDPNRQMLLAKNPNFHEEYYPKSSINQEKRILSGKKLPFVDYFMFSNEKESIPRWSKFLQGYYDQSAISSDNYDQIIHLDEKGNATLSLEMQKQNLHLETAVMPAIYYMGFNMLDPIVGGYDEKHKKLRQAISIAVDYNEFVSIFLNGRGVVAQGPIPSEIFGYQAEDFNPYIFDKINQQLVRKSIETAKKLLKEAGYPEGRDPQTQQPLILSLDLPVSNSPDSKAEMDWFREQFAKLGIDLQIRATQYNQFQEKMRNGDSQIFMWGWHADYPDPENFLFLLYGKNSKVTYGGENVSNYNNASFDDLFLKMKAIPNSSLRFQLIQKMIKMVQNDTPWIWGFYPKAFVISHQWVYPETPNTIANNTLKYVNLDINLREQQIKKWNKPMIWPFLLLSFTLLTLVSITIGLYFKKQYQTPKRINFD